MMPVYDSIGQSYSKFRVPDPRIVDSLVNLLQLEPGSSIADIGVGTGNIVKRSQIEDISSLVVNSIHKS